MQYASYSCKGGNGLCAGGQPANASQSCCANGEALPSCVAPPTNCECFVVYWGALNAADTFTTTVAQCNAWNGTYYRQAYCTTNPPPSGMWKPGNYGACNGNPGMQYAPYVCTGGNGWCSGQPPADLQQSCCANGNSLPNCAAPAAQGCGDTCGNMWNDGDQFCDPLVGMEYRCNNGSLQPIKGCQKQPSCTAI